jgi:hypothetical protein
VKLTEGDKPPELFSTTSNAHRSYGQDVLATQFTAKAQDIGYSLVEKLENSWKESVANGRTSDQPVAKANTFDNLAHIVLDGATTRPKTVKASYAIFYGAFTQSQAVDLKPFFFKAHSDMFNTPVHKAPLFRITVHTEYTHFLLVFAHNTLLGRHKATDEWRGETPSAPSTCQVAFFATMNTALFLPGCHW